MPWTAAAAAVAFFAPTICDVRGTAAAESVLPSTVHLRVAEMVLV